MNQTTLERLTLINTGLLIIVVWKVFFAVDNATSSVHTMAVEPTQSAVEPLNKPQEPVRDTPPSNSGAKNYAELLEQTIEPLERAFSEHGEQPMLPSETDLQAAIATNRLTSEESKKVLEMLEAGYSQYNMPFPKLEIPTGEQRTTTSAPIQNEAPENTAPPNYGEWLRRTTDTLEKVLKEKKEARTGLIPTEQELQAAIESGDPLSESSRLVIDMLKNGYARFKMEFPEYGQTQSEAVAVSSAEPSKSVQQKVSQKRILKSYFQGQVQRLTTEANSQSIDVTADLPQQELVEAAIESGTLQSESSEQVLSQLEACYKKLGLTFYRPPSQ